MANSAPPNRPPPRGSAEPPGPDPKADQERACDTVSDLNPDGFKNDPNDPTSPNEAIEKPPNASAASGAASGPQEITSNYGEDGRGGFSMNCISCRPPILDHSVRRT